MKETVTFIHRDRVMKAKMIEAVLGHYLGRAVAGFELLDVGSGNGQISDYFNAHNVVSAVDIRDRRLVKDNGVDFRIVDSEVMPFEDNRFDIVLSHHVIEHVPNQDLHVEEIKRVLKPTGACYLATPNRTSPFMQEHRGNNQVFRYRDIGPFCVRHGFDVNEYAVTCLKDPGRFFMKERMPQFLPAFLLRRLRPIFPSHIFVLQSRKP